MSVRPARTTASSWPSERRLAGRRGPAGEVDDVHHRRVGRERRHREASPGPTRPTGARGAGAAWWRRRAGSGRRRTGAGDGGSISTSSPWAASRGSSRDEQPRRAAGQREAGERRHVGDVVEGPAHEAQRAGGIGAGQPPRRAEQAGDPVERDVGAVGDLQGPLDQPVRVVGGVGEAEVVERRDARRTGRGWPGAIRGSSDAATQTSTDEVKSPRQASAIHRMSPPRPVGSSVVDLPPSRRPTPASSAGSVAPEAETMSAHSTARRWRGSSSQSSSSGAHEVGEVVAAEQEEGHRRSAQARRQVAGAAAGPPASPRRASCRTPARGGSRCARRRRCRSRSTAGR